MKTIPLSETFFQGVLSVERAGRTLRPWRLPHYRRHLFPAPDDSLMQTAACPSGVRLRFVTDACEITVRFDPLPAPDLNQCAGHAFDAVIDNSIVQTVSCFENAQEAVFNQIGEGQRTLEIWLPPGCPIALRDVQIPNAATVERPNNYAFGDIMTSTAPGETSLSNKMCPLFTYRLVFVIGKNASVA